MLVTARINTENGQEEKAEGGEEEQEEEGGEHEDAPVRASMSHLSYLSDTVDLSGSFSARNRRRDKLAVS
jgi:hypothetical protein